MEKCSSANTGVIDDSRPSPVYKCALSPPSSPMIPATETKINAPRPEANHAQQNQRPTEEIHCIKVQPQQLDTGMQGQQELQEMKEPYSRQTVNLPRLPSIK